MCCIEPSPRIENVEHVDGEKHLTFPIPQAMTISSLVPIPISYIYKIKVGFVNVVKR